MKRGVVALLAVGACSTEAIVIRPVIDGPTDPDSAAFPDLDAVTLTIAHAGELDDLVSQTFLRGEVIELLGVQFANDLVIHMSGRIGSSEVAYGRTCPFAITPDGQAAAPHLFFSRSVKFAALDITALPRSHGRAIMSYDGSAVFIGGETNGAPQIDVERFDPMLGKLEVVTQLSGRTMFVEAALGAGAFRVALVGGTTDHVAGAGFFELLDADNRRVDEFSDTKMARIDLTATALTDGRVVVIGGRNPSATATSGAIVTADVLQGTPEIRTLRAMLVAPRARHTATRLGDDVGAPVLIVGGIDSLGQPVATAELYKPLEENLANPMTFHPAMVVPRSQHRAVLMPDGSVLIIGGIDAGGNPVRALERFSIDAGFTAVGELPPGAGVIDSTVTTLPDGRILLVGGKESTGGVALDAAFIARLDPLDGAVDVVQTDRLAVARAGHQASLLCDGTVVLTGGADSTLVERYNPPALGRR